MTHRLSGIPIHHADEHLLVVSKPAGLLSVPGRGPDKQDCLVTRLQTRWPTALSVHRLDQPTSGLMVFALTPAVHRALSALFRTRQVHKRYEALVHGIVAGEQGDITLPLLTDWPNRPRQTVAANGKPSQTRWRVCDRHGATAPCRPTTRLRLEPLTGRSHQLRVHLAAIGHPIVGDALYGATEPADAAAAGRPSRLLLHATELALSHPVTGHAGRWHCPAPF